MNLTSPGMLSDLIFNRFSGEVTDHGDFIKVYTQSNPTFYYGNYLVFPEPPQDGDAQKWVKQFESTFAHDDRIKHYTFMWTPEHKIAPNVIEEFTKIGFEFDESSVLSAVAVKPIKNPPSDVSFKIIETEKEWRQVIELQLLRNDSNATDAEYRKYKEAQFVDYRKMVDADLGRWFGAFKQAELVADMGIFFDDTVGRFQLVETHPAHRRQGICSALVYHVSEWAFEHKPGCQLIIHADLHDVARSIYQNVGYEETEVLQSLYKEPAKA